MPKFYDYETQQEVSPQDAQALFQQGRLAIEQDATPAYVVDAQGQRYSTDDPSQLSDLLSQGFALETPEQTAQSNAVMEARNSPIQAGAEALAQGATLGLYGAAAGQLDRDYAEGMLLRRQEFGPGYGALEVAGGLAPALASGGAGAFTPAGLLARGTAAAGKALEGNLVARGVGQGAARILGLAAEGALDGAVSGAAAQLSEDSLGGTEISAERLAASGGLGALFGAGVGGAMGGLGAAAGKVASRVRNRAATEALSDPVERAARDAGYMRFVPDKIQENWADLAATSGRATREETLDVLNDATVRSEWLRAGQVKDDLNKRLRDSFQKVYDNDLSVRSAGAGEVHAETIAKLIPDSPTNAFKARVESNVLLNDLKDRLEAEGVADLLGKKRFGKLARDVAFFEQKINDAFENRSMAEGNVALANLKRTLWRYSEAAAKARPSTGIDVDAENWVKEFALDASEKARLLLEREDLFGQAGRNQRVRNAAWSKSIESGRQFNDLLSRDSGLKADPREWWRTKRILDAEKVAKRINNLDNPNAEFENGIIIRHLEDLDELYAAFRANGEIPTNQLKQFDSAHQAIRDARATFAEASEKVRKFNLLDTIEQADKDRSQLVQRVTSPGTLGVVGGFLGGGVGAALGAAAGTALSAATSPGAMVREVTKLEALGRRIRSVEQSTQRKTERAIRRLAMPRETRRKLQSNAVRAAVRFYGIDQAEQRAAAERVEKRLTEFRAEATRLAEAVNYQAAEMGSTAPKLTLAYAQLANRAASFLESKLPRPSTTPHKLQPKLNKTNWTTTDLDKFTKYLAAIRDPESVIEDLEAGRVSPESIEAVKAVYPTLFADMQRIALQEIAKHSNEMPFDSIIQLSLLLDVEGHPLMNPQMQATMKSIDEQVKQQQQAAQAPPAPGKTMKVEPSYLQRIQNL
jgi:hypothetical protein